MNEFNKMYINTEELQSEITKLKNSLLNSLNNKDTADTVVVKTDITNLKSSNEDILKTINPKEVSYNILSRVAHHDDFKSFKNLGAHNYYFDGDNNNILIPKVGLRVLKAGTYVIEPKFNIKIEKIVLLDFYT